MSKIAIVGAGQAGLLAAHALHDRGHEVTMYSDRSPEDFETKARPTGTAARFDIALEFERELGLEHWQGDAPNGDAVHLHFSPTRKNQLLTLVGRLDKPFLAIDVRLQSATWLRELVGKSAAVEVESVSIERLDEIAAGNDLTIVAAGRRELRDLFPRDEARSVYRKPQRFLAMVNVTGVPVELPYAPGICPVKFNFFAEEGEMFWVPWYSKDHKPSWSLLFEAKEGGPIDRFRESKSAEETLGIGVEVMREMTPWDADWLEDAEPCDDNSWLVGQFTPEVREIVGTLPSGRIVMALGDTAQSLDPIGGMGANNGNKMTRNLVECVEKHDEHPYDESWMRATFDRFWVRHHWGQVFNNTLLEPLTPEGQTILIAQYGSTGHADDTSPQQRLANRFVNNFNDPIDLTPAFHDEEKAKRAVAEAFHTSWPGLPLMKGKLAIGKQQLRQKAGRAPRHPGVEIAVH